MIRDTIDKVLVLRFGHASDLVSLLLDDVILILRTLEFTRVRVVECKMGSEATLPKWASEPCIMGINVPCSTSSFSYFSFSSRIDFCNLPGPMVYGCLYCARSYQTTLASLSFADSKMLKEEKREELFESKKANESIGWEVDVIDPGELSAKMLKNEGELRTTAELQEKLCLWASYRGQTLTKTVRGMMYYRKALELQAFLDMAKDEGYKTAE